MTSKVYLFGQRTLVRGRIAISALLVLPAAFAARTPTPTSDFRTEWQRVVLERLKFVMPASRTDSPAGVSTAALGRDSGTTATFASSVTAGRSFVNLEQARRLGRAYGAPFEHLLAGDLVRRFDSWAALDASIATDTPAFRLLMLQLYGRKFARRRTASPAYGGLFATEWRRVVNERLATVLPPPRERMTLPVSAAALGRLIDGGRTFATAVIRGPDFLTFAHARRVADALGQTPEHYLARDLVVASFASVSHLEDAVTEVQPSLRYLLLLLYVTGREATDSCAALTAGDR